jgi:hypothetical protein
MAETSVDWQSELISDIAGFTHNPLGFSRYAYPWGDGELSQSLGPRDWQQRVFGAIGEHLIDPSTRYQPCMVAVASGHGIGKSAGVGMLINWAMSTCEDCKVVLTANTLDQLRTKTWPEVAKWSRLAINSHWFNFQATSITAAQAGHDRIWRCDMVPWSENNTEAFAGLHNQGKRIVVIFDEASAIADKVWEVAEGALTDEKTEIIWLAFGNPTQNTGRFRECFGKYKHRWKTFQVDSRTVEGTNKAQIQKWIDDYGEDSDFVRVRVRGEFPRAGSNQFISSDVVAAARKYQAEGFEGLPKVLSVDVARFGDDQTVIGDRQGRKARLLKKFRGLDTVQVATRVIEILEGAKVWGDPYDGTVVDGDGLGAGVIDTMRDRGYGKHLYEFHGGATPDDPNKYFNRRAEVWGLMRDWLKAGAEIPDDAELADDLTGPQYGFSAKQQIQLEKKDDMKKRGLSSPDSGDCLAMTFSVTLASRNKPKSKAIYSPGSMNTGWMG